MKNQSLSQQTARRLYSLIAAEKRFAPGEKLPNELELARTLGVSRATLREAIRELAAPFRAMAAAPDGLIEAIYMPEKRFVWGVQWHPEFSYQVNQGSRKIFAAFLESARTA